MLESLTKSANSTGAAPEVDLVRLALSHRTASHPLFAQLRSKRISRQQARALLRNYDAHAGVLRRLLLRAASIMPESAVGYVLENVRTEFGAGNPADCHSLQLLDLAKQCGVEEREFFSCRIERGVKSFIKEACRFYDPVRSCLAGNLYRPAVSAGAITATEVLAIEEFKALQVAFASLGQENHIWFDHVTVEVHHTDDSLALAKYFMQDPRHVPAVLTGLNGVLDATWLLYDGFVAALNGPIS